MWSSQCDACRHAFHTWDWARKWFTRNNSRACWRTILYYVQYYFCNCWNSKLSYNARTVTLAYLWYLTVLGSIKGSTRTKDAEMSGDPTEPYQGIVPCKSFEQPIHFLAQPHTWNSCQEAPYWSKWRMFFKIRAGNDVWNRRSSFIHRTH